MKTLKLQLLAASMFACTAAFAQGSPNGPPTFTTRTPNAAAANFATGPNSSSNSTSFNSSREGYSNDSYVLQQGENQYARVDQIGGANQADIIQGPTGTANNAFQTQNYNTTGGRKNIGYIYQNGTSGTATQEQTGSSNTASVEQYGAGNGFTGGTGNTAFQRQDGDQNDAKVQQYNGDRDQAIQFQNGNLNSSTITQSNGSLNRAETNQQGVNNAAIVTQR